MSIKRNFALVILGMAYCCAAHAAGMTLTYAPENGEAGSGEVLLPKKVTEKTPAALCIHGGGWGAMSRKDVVGIAQFLADDLGYIVYNIDYRLASKERAWPACGEDCVKAGEYMFSEQFAKATGVRPKSILVIGGSAGGHLALWTGLKLGEKCDRIISISGIADPEIDYVAHPSMYRGLFGGVETVTREMRDTMSVMKLIRANGPKILLTHATQDKVVPIATAKSFLAAYRSAGNDIGLFEYPSYIQEGLTGHCIWIPDSKPHKLIPRLEREITYFLTPTPVPTPKRVQTKYEISAHYYAGTEHAAEWDMVAETMPERKPLLGWFDESDPENVDWQIKWAAEHGIAAYCLCWYWNQGVQRLDHWVQAFYRAQHRKHLKWYLMYANHNQRGAHSTADQIAVSKFWIDNYLKTPEYYTIDGEPVIVYCSSDFLDRDFIDEAAARGEKLEAGEGMKRAMAITERMAREAGIKGIHWVHLNWRKDIYDDKYVSWIKRGGFDSRMTYHFGNTACAICPEACGKRDYPRRFDFNVMCAASIWAAQRADSSPELPFWPSIPTGYDDTPRKFQDANKVIGRTPEKFRVCCGELKEICDKKGIRRLTIAPISEWQEGSMLEPNEDYGFKYYDIIRETFCEKPSAGWPKNLTPRDIGRGNLEYEPMYRAAKPEWNFNESQEGWYRNPFGCLKAEWDTKGYLSFRSAAGIAGRREGLNCWQHNVRAKCKPFAAERYSTFRLRMRLTPNAHLPAPKTLESTMRLRWGTTARPLIGAGNIVDYANGVATAKVTADGQWHEYAINLDHDVLWAGKVDTLWLQATELGQALVEIDWMRFETAKYKNERKFPEYVGGPRPISENTYRATGFFRIEKAEGEHWRTIDPNGREIVPLGVDLIRYEGCRSRGKVRRYLEWNKTHYPNIEAWRKETLGRLKEWGFNRISGGDGGLYRRGLIYSTNLTMGDSMCSTSMPQECWICPNPGKPCAAFPNVFSEKFREKCDEIARKRCVPLRNDPWLFGYYTDNELAWWGSDRRHADGLGLYDAVVKLPREHTARQALERFVREHGGGEVAKVKDEVKLGFLRLAADIYFRETTAAIRRADPNHLVLGARFAGLGGANVAVWEIAGKYCDAVSFNIYPWANLERNMVFTWKKGTKSIADTFAERYEIVKKPFLITEWSFSALDSGLPCTKGAGQHFNTQAERTQACELFARIMLNTPSIIGYDYFMWVDEPPEGVTDVHPENTNYGLVNERGEPYPLTKMFARLHADINAVRAAGMPAERKLPPKAAAKKQAKWEGFECGMGIGGWLTNYKRFNVLPQAKRLVLTEGDYAHFDTYITEGDVARIKHWGFDHIRLGFDQIVVEEKAGVYRERTFKKIDDFIGWCGKHKINVVLNLHKAIGNYCDIAEKVKLLDDEGLQQRFINLWVEIERRYHDFPGVAFEILNEVRDVDAEKWNALADRTIKAIREKNADRWIVVGSTNWNSVETLSKLKVWDDKKVVYTFHEYEPFNFTHQRGVLQAPTLFRNEEVAAPSTKEIAEHLGYASKWLKEHPDKILWNGEFGTIRHANPVARVSFMRDVVAFCRREGIPYCVWNYLSTPNDGNRFSLVDDVTRDFLSDALLDACLGKGDAAADGQLTLMSFNLWGAYFGNPIYERDLKEAAIIRRDEPDIVCCQEAEPRIWASRLFTVLASDYGVVRSEGQPKREFNPILYRKSRLELIEGGTELFAAADNPEGSKGFGWGIFRDKATQRRFIACSTHLWWRQDNRQHDEMRVRNVREIFAKVGELRAKHGDLPLFVLGDMNATLNNQKAGRVTPLTEFAAVGMADAQYTAPKTAKWSTHHGDPKRDAHGNLRGWIYASAADAANSIDHVFYTANGVEPIEFAIDRSQYALEVSDHSPIRFTFRFK